MSVADVIAFSDRTLAILHRAVCIDINVPRIHGTQVYVRSTYL